MDTYDVEYACLFCRVGSELSVARNLEQSSLGVQACAVQVVKRRTFQGTTTREKQVLLPGYVFVQVPSGFLSSRHLSSSQPTEVPLLLQVAGVRSILTTGNGQWQLFGRDKRFAEWLFAHNGLIAFSKAYRDGERIRIVSGPLKDLENHIIRVDKRNQNGQVSLLVGGREVLVWLGYDLVEVSRQ